MTQNAQPVRLILLDGNNLGMAAQQSGGGRLLAGERETTAIYGFLRTLRAVKEGFPGRAIVLWDGRSWRHDVFASYKAGRDATPEAKAMRASWKEQRLVLARALPALGVGQMMAANLEADDLAARVRRSIVAKGGSVLLVTGDRDWLQLVGPGCAVWNPRKELLVTEANFSEVTDLPHPRAIAELKALAGKPQEMPGVGGIGEVTARAILKAHGGVDAYVNRCLDDAGFYDSEKAAGNRRSLALVDDAAKYGAFQDNMRLAWLDHPDAPKAEGLKVVKGALDLEAFRRVCEELAFLSMLRGLEAWAAPFMRED